MAQLRRLRAIASVGTPFASYTSKASITTPRRDVMKFETMMLKGFFVAGLLVCALALGGMLSSHVSAPESVASNVSAHR